METLRAAMKANSISRAAIASENKEKEKAASRKNKAQNLIYNAELGLPNALPSESPFEGAKIVKTDWEIKKPPSQPAAPRGLGGKRTRRRGH